MQTKKISLKEIQGVLSRSEMKKIMAGSGSGSWCYTCKENGEVIWAYGRCSANKQDCDDPNKCEDYDC